MEIGPTTHYIMGGIRVDSDTQMSSIPGLFAAGECAAGINGANRLGGNSLSDLLVFGKRAGEYSAKFARENARVAIDEAAAAQAADSALRPFERGTSGSENPYAIQSALQELMQSHVGIVRTESEMQHALVELEQLKHRADRAGIVGNREYNPGWHTAIDLRNLITVSEAITRSAIERKESRGGHFREDYPDKNPEYATFNILTRKARDGSMETRRLPLPPMPAELKQIIEEQKS
jgi:succinate dehydrogenase / fumarate reductase flavoprotein subunit